MDDFGYKEEVLDTVDEYLGTETKNYKIIIAALIFGHFGIKIQTYENNTMNYSVLSPYDYKDKKYIFGTKEYITETLWHEICHLTINGITKMFINRLDKKEKVLPEKFTKIFYTDTEAIANEYIIRAITIRLFEICNKNDIADYYLKYHIQKGFNEIESVKNYLEKHCEENNKLIKDEKYKEFIKYVMGII